HFSALWPELESFARDGRVAMAMIASGKLAVVPEGATRPVFSTNPFAFATPVAGGDPVVFDFSTSSMSHGDLQLLRAEGREVPIAPASTRPAPTPRTRRPSSTEAASAPSAGTRVRCCHS